MGGERRSQERFGKGCLDIGDKAGECQLTEAKMPDASGRKGRAERCPGERS